MRIYDLGGDGTEEASDRILTVANGISLVRLLGMPVLFWLLARGDLLEGVILGGVLGSTDWVDGYVARRFDQVTKLGKVLDPIADRVFIAVVTVSLVISGLLPVWVPVAILTRDLLLGIAGLVFMRGRELPGVTRLGKTANFGIMVSFLPLLLSGILESARDPHEVLHVVAMVILIPSIVAYWATGFQYARAIAAAQGTDAGYAGQTE